MWKRAWLPILATAVLLTPFVIYQRLATIDQLVRFFPDDAFYYLQSAYNFTRLGFPTFDGVHTTNGFHPLNFLLVTLLALPLEKHGLLGATFVVQAALLLISAAVIVRRMWRESDAWAWLMTAVATLPVFTLFVLVSFGLEAAVVVATTVLLQSRWELAAAAGFRSPRLNICIGAALGLLVLARIDLALVWVPYLGAYLLSSNRLRPRMTTWASQFLFIWGMAGLLVAAYLATNIITMGHVLPVSAWVKAQYPRSAADWTPSTNDTPIGWAMALAPLGVSVLCLMIPSAWRSTSEHALPRLKPLNIANVLWYAYLALAVPWIFRWYFAFPIACLLHNIPAMVHDARVERWRFEGRKTFITAGAVTAVALNLLITTTVLRWIGNRPSSVSYHLLQIARQLDQVAGSKSITAVADAGVIGFFATGRVVNIDGLANDFDFATNFLGQGRLSDYFRREGITHYLARDGHLANRASVLANNHVRAESLLDPTLSLAREHELFRYAIPGDLTVVCFVIDQKAR